MRNIYLVGFMGTGKSAVGKELANRLGLEFIDLDILIEKRENLKINEIFNKKGEPYFRKKEKELLEDKSQNKNLVVSCGGGVVLDKQNIENMKKTGTMICLVSRTEIILERTNGYNHRPLLNTPDAKTRIEELLKLRAPYYAQADYTIDTSDLTIEEVLENILNIIERER